MQDQHVPISSEEFVELVVGRVNASVVGAGPAYMAGVVASSLAAYFKYVGRGVCEVPAHGSALLGQCEPVGEFPGVDVSAEVCGDVGCDAVGAGVQACVSSRGPNWARNKAARDRKKRAKERKQSVGASVPEWRQKSGSGVHRGQFADMPHDVQRELKESRARALIAKNKREEKEHLARVDALDSPEQIFYKAMDMMKLAEQAAKKKNESKVMGWVETVASSHAESLAKSAPSSVPSYASVCKSATSLGSVGGVKDWSVSKVRMNAVEARLVDGQAATVAVVEALRKDFGRQLVYGDIRKVVPGRPVVSYSDEFDY